jgi:hypothetical protein
MAEYDSLIVGRLCDSRLSESPLDSKAGALTQLKGACFAVVAIMCPVTFAMEPDAAPGNEMHRTSSYIRSVISAGLPRFTPAIPLPNHATTKSGPASNTGTIPSDVVAMPAFTITEAKLPTTRQTMTYTGWTQPLVDKYMGPADGIDRGILNRYTLAQLWAKIPIVGRLPFIGTAVQMTVSERALDDAGANDPLRTKPIE